MRGVFASSESYPLANRGKFSDARAACGLPSTATAIRCSSAASARPGSSAPVGSIRIGYTETLPHRFQAGANLLFHLSRFQPCGLTRLYALHYGTSPIVRGVGGFADTVLNADAKKLRLDTAIWIVFPRAQCRAHARRHRPGARALPLTIGMAQATTSRHAPGLRMGHVGAAKSGAQSPACPRRPASRAGARKSAVAVGRF